MTPIDALIYIVRHEIDEFSDEIRAAFYDLDQAKHYAEQLCRRGCEQNNQSSGLQFSWREGDGEGSWTLDYSYEKFTEIVPAGIELSDSGLLVWHDTHTEMERTPEFISMYAVEAAPLYARERP